MSLRKVVKESIELTSMQKNDRRVLLSSGIELEKDIIKNKIETAIKEQDSIARIIQFFDSNDFYATLGDFKYDAPYGKRERITFEEKEWNEQINFKNNAKAIYYYFDNIKEFSTFLDDEKNRKVLRLLTEEEFNTYLKSNSINKKDLLKLLINNDEYISKKIKN